VPVRITLAPPVYPAAARKQGIGGNVMLLVDVDVHGNVAKAIVEKSQPEGVFDAAALEAVGKWKFTPAMKNGKAIAGRIRVPIDFYVQ
jgi:TonB family protein